MRQILSKVKSSLSSLLEKHPLGYYLAVQVMRRTDLLLPHEQDYLGFAPLSLVFPGAFLDLGANQGHSARGFHKLVKGRPIVSVEANPYHAPALEATRNRIPNYTFHLRAVDRVSDKRLALFTPIYRGIICHSAASTSLEEARATIRRCWPRLFPSFRFEKSEVETLAIDDLHLAVGIAKIDIEIKEVDAILGCMDTIARCRPAFLVEVVSELDRILTLFTSLGYRPFNYQPGLGFTPLQDRPLTRNLFFLPSEKCPEVVAAAA
jgi:FkbM family methyltransferase